MKGKLIAAVLFLGLAAVAAAPAHAQSIHSLVKPITFTNPNMDTHLPPGFYIKAPAYGLTVDPYYIVHQAYPGGPISVYRTNDPAVIAVVQSTPDNGVSPDGDTTYLIGTPYLSTAMTKLSDSLYIGK